MAARRRICYFWEGSLDKVSHSKCPITRLIFQDFLPKNYVMHVCILLLKIMYFFFFFGFIHPNEKYNDVSMIQNISYNNYINSSM